MFVLFPCDCMRKLSTLRFYWLVYVYVSDELKSRILTEKLDLGKSKVWNLSPDNVKNVKTLGIAKSEINKFCKTLPI